MSMAEFGDFLRVQLWQDSDISHVIFKRPLNWEIKLVYER